jgi:DNA repair protein RadA/Sms
MSQATHHKALAQTAPVLSLADIEAIDVPRFGTGIEEFDRVLGGGLVAGGVVLIGGDPGIGKSTLLLQALANLAATRNTLYVSGEESGAQIALRAKRLQVEARDLKLQAEIQLEKDPRHPGRRQARSGRDRLDPDPVFGRADFGARARCPRCASARPS